MRYLWLVAALAVAGSAEAQERAPNRRDVVEQVSAADPARFACAHQEGRACKHDWIKAVAWALHQTDARWGLNMKRDRDSEGLSMDVVTWRIGPTDRHVQAFDICGNCGGGRPTVEWNDITNWSTLGNPGTARWVQPEPVGGSSSGGGGTPIPAPPSPPTAPVLDLSPVLNALKAIEARLAALEAKGAVTDAAAFEAKNAAERASEIKTLLENLPASKPVPCLTGRVPKAFGGSSEVTFCPKE